MKLQRSSPWDKKQSIRFCDDSDQDPGTFYCDTCYRSVIYPSVTLEHPLKPLDGMICYLAGTLTWSHVVSSNIVRVPGSPTREGEI